jgi:hypothetical protein
MASLELAAAPAETRIVAAELGRFTPVRRRRTIAVIMVVIVVAVGTVYVLRLGGLRFSHVVFVGS